MNSEEQEISRKHNSMRTRKRSRNRRRLYCLAGGGIIVIAAMIALIVALKGNGETKGYGAPEKAIEAFAKNISKNKIDKAIEGFAYEDLSGNVKFTNNLEQMQVWMPYSMDAPEYDAYGTINEIYYKNQAAGQVKMLCYSLCGLDKLDEPLDGGMILQMGGSSYDAKSLKKALNPEKLKKVKLERTDAVKGSEDNNAVLAAGAEKTKSYTALYKVDKKYYKGSFVLGQYSGKWKIVSLSLNTESPYGTAAETTEEEYKKSVE